MISKPDCAIISYLSISHRLLAVNIIHSNIYQKRNRQKAVLIGSWVLRYSSLVNVLHYRGGAFFGSALTAIIKETI